MTKRLVILNAKRERIRLPFKRETDCHSRLHGFAMTKGVGKRIATHLTAVSPAGSVGASASQRCPPDTRTAMTRTTANRTFYGVRNDKDIYDIQKSFSTP